MVSKSWRDGNLCLFGLVFCAHLVCICVHFDLYNIFIFSRFLYILVVIFSFLIFSFLLFLLTYSSICTPPTFSCSLITTFWDRSSDTVEHATREEIIPVWSHVFSACFLRVPRSENTPDETADWGPGTEARDWGRKKRRKKKEKKGEKQCSGSASIRKPPREGTQNPRVPRQQTITGLELVSTIFQPYCLVASPPAICLRLRAIVDLWPLVTKREGGKGREKGAAKQSC